MSPSQIMKLLMVKRANYGREDKALCATFNHYFKTMPTAKDGIRSRWQDFYRFRDAGAYLSAAVCLVPEGWTWDVNSDGEARVWINKGGRPYASYSSVGATPALALAMSAVKAREDKTAGEMGVKL